MYALLVLHENGHGVRVMVKIQAKKVRAQVVAFLEGNHGREAFELLKQRAQVEAYVPEGTRPRIVPAFTLDEAVL